MWVDDQANFEDTAAVKLDVWPDCLFVSGFITPHFDRLRICLGQHPCRLTV